MMNLTQQLDRLEARIQAMVEGRLAGLLAPQKTAQQIAQQLVQATQLNSITLEDQRTLAPAHFILQVHPSQASRIQENQALLREMEDLIFQEGKQAGLAFEQRPRVEVISDEDVPTGEIVVIARVLQPEVGTTRTMPVDAVPDPAYPLNAFLIVDGLRVFPLDKVTINIGRREENDLVIDDPRVSRQHAQLRASQGRYQIFDLGSTGGTFVNKVPITQATLQPGDVISLAGFSLVFGQDKAASSRGETQELHLVQE
ncbi:MAG: DUF3662 domain-containing protein [Anaerolineales bacterium]|nr:DUF3662 domain-containing protein [Anaerolineales bacterium]